MQHTFSLLMIYLLFELPYIYFYTRARNSGTIFLRLHPPRLFSIIQLLHSVSQELISLQILYLIHILIQIIDPHILPLTTLSYNRTPAVSVL